MLKRPRVKDYMTSEVEYISCEATVKEAIEKMLASDHHKFPVVRDGRLIGMISAKDLLRHKDELEMKIKDILKEKKEVVVATPDLSLDDAARILFRKGYKTLPVISKDGRLIGIISTIDIIRSHIERATPRKVEMIKNLLENEYGVEVHVHRYLVPIDKLRPTQQEIYADELEGRKYELKKGLAEPIIVIKRKNYYVLVDGHHRAVAALELGIKELSAHVLEPIPEIELRMERAAIEKGLITLKDIKILEYPQHPLIEITTKPIKEEDLK
ncbi:MAG: transcriptional regulator [Candidatus Altiarchaeales archaeon]|nr:MAG: transcriptional regulator [Candidatus Altiarchaeales archaeon]